MRTAARLRALLLIAGALLALAACARTPDDATVIEFWDFPHLPDLNSDQQEILAAFERDHPGVRVRFTRLPWQDGQQKVTLAVQAGRPPDICGQVNVSTQFIQQGMLEPVDEIIAAEPADWHPSYLEAVSLEGHTYALPFYRACYVLLLNTELFEKRGVPLPAGGRWTWEEFSAALDRLTYYDEERRRQYYGLVTNLGPAEYEAYTLILHRGGRVLQRGPDGEVICTIAEEPFVRGFKDLAALDFARGVAVPGIGAMTQEQSWNHWRDTRTAAMTIQGAWCLTAVRIFNQSVERRNDRLRESGRTSELQQPLKWSVAAPPADPGTTPTLMSSGLGTYVLFRQRDDAKRRLCLELLRRLTSTTAQRALVHENTYPSRRSAGNLWADDPQLGPIFALFPDAVQAPLVPGLERLDRVLQSELQRALLRDRRTGGPQADPREACENAAAKIAALLDRAQR